MGSSHRELGRRGQRWGGGVEEAEDTGGARSPVGAQAGRQMCPSILFRVEV